MTQHPYHFDGLTIREDATAPARLTPLLDRVYLTMRYGGWFTLGALSTVCGGSEASVSARIRDLRKNRFGAHNVERAHLGGGGWVYRLNCHDHAVKP